ncbi:MAG: thiamine pyrophosphate-binding protein [Bdellovibrio sp.]
MSSELDVLLNKLWQMGVTSICFCAGARNLSLARALQEDARFQLHPFFDERSASFFAMGQCVALGRPCLVITTSGTAVAECLPAVIEAFYQRLPLIIWSADRPSSFRWTGAPQSMDQSGLLESHCEMVLDFPSLNFEVLVEQLQVWKLQGPLHLNTAFLDPLRASTTILAGSNPSLQHRLQHSCESLFSKHQGGLELQDPLVVCGPMDGLESQRAKEFLLGLDCLFYPELLSGLKADGDLKEKELFSWPDFSRKDQPVLRLGGVPTHSAWRDLEAEDRRVVSISSKAWPGMARGSEVFPWETASHLCCFQSDEEKQRQRQVSEIHLEKVRLEIQADPWGEKSQIRELLECFPKAGAWYWGNSLPVRYADEVFTLGPRSQGLRFWGHRGMNGIDGQVSGFLGWAMGLSDVDEVVGVLGDLTALADLVGLWPLSPRNRWREQTESQSSRLGLPKKIRLVVLNNQGGQIFSRWNSPLLMNSHRIDFSSWASLFQWGFWQGRAQELREAKLSNFELIELQIPAQGLGEQKKAKSFGGSLSHG